MSTVLRPRLDAAVQINGEWHTVNTTLRDTVELKIQFKGQEFTGSAEDATKLVYLACKRSDVFKGSWDDFVDAVEDMEIREPPPLPQEPASKAS